MSFKEFLLYFFYGISLHILITFVLVSYVVNWEQQLIFAVIALFFLAFSFVLSHANEMFDFLVPIFAGMLATAIVLALLLYKGMVNL